MVICGNATHAILAVTCNTHYNWGFQLSYLPMRRPGSMTNKILIWMQSTEGHEPLLHLITTKFSTIVNITLIQRNKQWSPQTTNTFPDKTFPRQLTNSLSFPDMTFCSKILTAVEFPAKQSGRHECCCTSS